MADQTISLARMAGDAALAAFFSGEKRAARENARMQYEAELKAYLEAGDGQAGIRLDGVAQALRRQEKPVVPFHWEIEFPEVFDLDDFLRVRGGFDAMVGNPPFAGKNTLIEGNAAGYLEWLKTEHAESHGNADLVAHFFRRAFTLLKKDGCFGLIATNTIGQGDTRSTGLRWICLHEGTIYRAVKRLKWPGEAAVIVSVVHVCKGEVPGTHWLSGREVGRITAYLFHSGGHEEPATLAENEGKSFIGSYVLGMGFTFDDTDKDGVASPIAVMQRLIEKDPRNSERIFPYLGGDEMNNSPTHAHHRYVINFEDFPLRRKETGHSWFDLREETQREQLREGIVAPDYPRPVAADWPDLLRIVEERSKGTRAAHSTAHWWHFERSRIELARALAGRVSALAVSRVTQQVAFVRIPSSIVAAETTVVVAESGGAAFAVLQSRPHEIWARFMASSLEDRLRYTPTDCFETFPFPAAYEQHPALDSAGQAYYDHRAGLMVRNNEGLTKTYNRFHRPDEYSPDILKLRELHEAMDRAVLDAYGWQDLQPKCDFFPEFDEEEADDAESGRPRQKKYRYRWPDEIHDEVLARLLALNRERAGLFAGLRAHRLAETR